MKNILLVALVILVGYTFYSGQHEPASHSISPTISAQRADQSDASITKAFANHESNLQVSGQGIVIKLLADDDNGSRHQKFLLKLSTGQSILVAHNIDLAPRINALRKGDAVQFYGEYEWNEKGGVLHWTHKDPNGKHPDGWLQHQNQRYQ